MTPSKQQLRAMRRVRGSAVNSLEVNAGGRGVAARTYRSLLKHEYVTWTMMGWLELTSKGRKALT